MIISMIAAMADNRIIGKDNQMPWHLPADFVWFKRCTMGKPVVMGRKTYESIGRPLPGRLNIVISRDESLSIEGVTTVTSIEQALEVAGDVEEVMIIGGGAIYSACLPLATKLYVTHIEAAIEGDTQFPDWGNEFKETYSEAYQADEKNAYNMRFTILENNSRPNSIVNTVMPFV
ncbi:type 3 dihydrofolate reductase [uncultured Vibrio sp.]|uniref:type 3 dihydrofolate reductase n=1 Tax=uncultured Vibrio sp. TaxID=114054 RepID=UPI002AA64D41|nr:type 3 dihydrofolate reductase [uncultured Vibrio sp.]